MATELKANVYVDGVLYEAGSTPPKEIADRISNPKAWGEAGSAADSEPSKKPATKKAAPSKSSR